MVIEIVLLCVSGLHGLSTARCVETYSRATAIIERQISVRFELAKRRSISNPFTTLSYVGQQETLLHHYSIVMQRIGRRVPFQEGRERVYLAIIPPLFDAAKEHWFMAGLTTVTCPRKYKITAASIMVGEEENFYGAKRFRHGVIGVNHELLHNLGAYHIRSEYGILGRLSIMDENILAHATERGAARISAKSKREIASCLNWR